jgi:asparagine synthase (glutamine-hydrolysing)
MKSLSLPFDRKTLEPSAERSAWVVDGTVRAVAVEPSRDGRGAATPTDGSRPLSVLGRCGPGSPEVAGRGHCHVVFEGVLYNRAELSTETTEPLEPTASDAEVLLDAYLRLGPQVLARTKGVFAVVIWDGRDSNLICARDAIGIHPLFYAGAGDRILLSPSIDALIAHPHVSRAVNRAALADRLCHRFPDNEETYFQAVKRVPPGHAMRVGTAGRHVYRYWDPAPPDAPIDWIDEDELERFDELLERAVTRCLELGPAGIYLSGGLDSVTVAGVAADGSHPRGLPPPVALSLAFPDPDSNEEEVQRDVAAGLGLPQSLVPLDDAVGAAGLLMSALDMSSAWPVPLLNLWLPAYEHLASEASRRGCRVILTGGGGDEWLCVSPFYAADLMRSLDIRGFCRLMLDQRRSYRGSRRWLARNLLWTNGAEPLVRARVGRILRAAAPRAYRAQRRRRISRSTPDWVAPDPGLRREIDRRAEETRPEPERGSFYLRAVRSSLDHALVATEMEEWFEHGRRAGVSVVQPFRDADLVDFLYRTPPDLLTQGGREKGLVREALDRRFPDLGFERQKKVTAADYYRNTLLSQGPRALKKMGGTRALGEIGVVHARGATRLLEDILSGSHLDDAYRDAYRIWDTLSLEAWLRPRV